VLYLRYDPLSRTGFVRLREGETAWTRRLTPHAVAEYDRRRRLLAIFVTDLDPDAAEFLRMGDEETLLGVIGRYAEPGPWEPVEAPQPARPRRGRRRARAPRPAVTPRAARPAGSRSGPGA